LGGSVLHYLLSGLAGSKRYDINLAC
jgi:hypothetical protein